MRNLRIHIVTFNDAEATAVETLFRDIEAPGPSPATSWIRTNNTLTRRSSGGLEEITHRPLGAQGNVAAGTALLETFTREFPWPDYVVFYACAGATRDDFVGHAFLVDSSSYVSLGTVATAPGSAYVVPVRAAIGAALDAAQTLLEDLHTRGIMTGSIGPLKAEWPVEYVTLKNKWLCQTASEVEPFEEVRFSEALWQDVDLLAATGLDTAHVAGTDKVVKVGPGQRPIQDPALPLGTYRKDEWSYGEALAFIEERCDPLPLLVEMEAYGIGRAMDALRLRKHVAIIRIVTDALANKDAMNQSPHLSQDVLMNDWLCVLACVLGSMIRAARGM